jgi:hypothetical protein
MAVASNAQPRRSGPLTPPNCTPAIPRQPWVIQYPKNEKVPIGSRLPPSVVTDRINVNCSSAYNIRALFAEWTPQSNLIVHFTMESKEKNISNTSATIVKLIAPSLLTSEKVALSYLLILIISPYSLPFGCIKDVKSRPRLYNCK